VWITSAPDVKFFSRSPLLRWALIVAGLGPTVSSRSAAAAQPSPTANRVDYSPTKRAIHGYQPFRYQYDLIVTSPALLPVGRTQVIIATTLLSGHSSFSTNNALSYISFVTPDAAVPQRVITFSGPNESRTISVTLNLPGSVSDADLTFHIRTDGWPAGITDNGSFIHVSVSPLPTYAGPGSGQSGGPPSYSAPDHTATLLLAAFSIVSVIWLRGRTRRRV